MEYTPRNFKVSTTLSYYSRSAASRALKSEAERMREFADSIDDGIIFNSIGSSPKELREAADQLEAFARAIETAKPIQ